MDLREIILENDSQATCAKAISWVGNDQCRFDELTKLFLHDKEKHVVQLAGWLLSEIVLKYPMLVHKHLGKIIQQLKQHGITEGVKRNTVRLLQGMDIPEKHHGEVMNLCFDYIISPAEKAAVKAFSLTVLGNLTEQYPEIKQELRAIIEDRWNFETAAFHSRARKLLKKL